MLLGCPALCSQVFREDACLFIQKFTIQKGERLGRLSGDEADRTGIVRIGGVKCCQEGGYMLYASEHPRSNPALGAVRGVYTNGPPVLTRQMSCASTRRRAMRCVVVR